MNFLLYYILRKFFVKLRFSDKEICLEKGLLLKRAAVMPLSSVVKITARRTLIMRLFLAKEITVFTLGGKLVFYLSKNERLPFLPQKRDNVIKARFGAAAFGAFIDTRALGGLFVFTAVLRKFSAILGSEYFNRLISVLTGTVNELEKALGFFRVAVPRIAVTLAVFALGAWVFAYVRKLLRLSRFRVSKNGGMLFVGSGVLTLYEHMLVQNSAELFGAVSNQNSIKSPNSAAAIYCETVTTLITRRAPLYFRGVMVCPCVKRGELPKTLKTMFGMKIPQKKLRSPRRAFLGHIAAPLSWLGVFCALLAAAYCSGYSAMLLKTVLYSGAIVNLYTAVLYLLYMYRSGIACGKNGAAVYARRGLRLYTAVLPNGVIKQITVSQSLFQKRSGLCNFKLGIVERRKFIARQLPKKELLRRTPF